MKGRSIISPFGKGGIRGILCGSSNAPFFKQCLSYFPLTLILSRKGRGELQVSLEILEWCFSKGFRKLVSLCLVRTKRPFS